MLHTTIRGEGSPLVLLHGFCEDSRIWRDILPALEKNHRVVGMDLPGFGKSVPGTADLSDWADAVVGTLGQNGVAGSFHILGHSMGGYVSLAVAALFPERVRSLTFLHSSAFADDDEKKKNRDRNIESVKKYGKIPFVKGLVPGLFSPDYKDEGLQFAMDIAMEQGEEGIINALEAMKNRPDRTNVLKEAGFPVQIISGKNDKLLNLDAQAEQASMGKFVSFNVLKESGHMGMLEEPGEVIRILVDFLSLK